MFKRSKKNVASIDTWVGKNTRLQGDIHFSGGLHVDGHIKGNVIADDTVSSVVELSEGGVIEGMVQVPTVVLNGQVIGDVHASERLALAAGARVSGDVYYQLIEIAMGAEVNGKLVHTTGGVAVDTGAEEGERGSGHLKAVE